MIRYNNTPYEDVLLCACAHPHVRLRYNRFSHKWVTVDSHKGTMHYAAATMDSLAVWLEGIAQCRVTAMPRIKKLPNNATPLILFKKLLDLVW